MSDSFTKAVGAGKPVYYKNNTIIGTVERPEDINGSGLHGALFGYILVDSGVWDKVLPGVEYQLFEPLNLGKHLFLPTVGQSERLPFFVSISNAQVSLPAKAVEGDDIQSVTYDTLTIATPFDKGILKESGDITVLSGTPIFSNALQLAGMIVACNNFGALIVPFEETSLYENFTHLNYEVLDRLTVDKKFVYQTDPQNEQTAEEVGAAFALELPKMENDHA